MADIINFPSHHERQWPQFEEIFRSMLIQAGMGPEGVDWIIADIKPRLKAVDGELHFSVSGPEGSEPAIREAVNKVRQFQLESSNKFLEQMLVLEIELYIALHPDKAPPQKSA
jgi:hypothetical protein